MHPLMQPGAVEHQPPAAGFHNCPLKQPVCQRRGHQHMDGEPSGRLTEDRDLSGVASESLNIVLYPLQRGNLVHKAVVTEQSVFTLFCERRMREETEPPQAVVKADKDNSLARKLAAIVDRGRAATVHKTTAINPDHDRKLSSPVFRYPDIQNETIFSRCCAQWRRITGEGKLHTVMPIV